MAALLTDHGHPVTYQAVPVTDWIAAATAAGLPADYAEFLARLLAGIGAGNGALPNSTVEQVTGRPAGSLTDVLSRELSTAR